MTNSPLASISKVTLHAESIALTLVVFLLGLATTQPTQARTFTVLYNFTGAGGGGPEGGLVRDKAGNLYGTNFGGGPHGWGTVFELTPKAGGGWTEKVLHSFNRQDGLAPWGAGVILDTSGNLYGTTMYGGSGTCNNYGTPGCGTVFELRPKTGGGWSEEVLCDFQNNGTDGNYPQAGVIFDAAGNLYGTTLGGGTDGYGTAFELISTKRGTWTEKVLHDFNSNDGGGSPDGSLIFNSSGNLFGTITGSGNCNSGNGCGSVFELIPKASGAWTAKVLHKFNGADGDSPGAGLILDASGNLYGTTEEGGNGTCNGGCGIVFELTQKTGGAWTEKVLHKFNGSDGYGPDSLIFDNSSNLYGLTYLGGTHRSGTVFELTP